MSRPTISRWLWWTFAWTAAIALGIAFHFQLEYRDRVVSLPPLVDANGNTASLEAAMAGLDSYERAGRVRRLEFISLGIGAVLFMCAAVTKREDTNAA
jgi:hypothetical protein